MNFHDFSFKPELLRAITESGFEHTSEVQQECLHQALLGRDILCQAKSGMGKTTVFILSTLNHLHPVDGHCAVLVLCHNRELAFQIAKDYERFSKYMPTTRVAVFFGGVSVTSDEKILATNPPHIVIGTPGRILALLRSRKFSLKTVKHFILDECDQMLEQQETRHEVEEIFQGAQSDYHKQVMVFTTSLPKDIRLICKRYLQNPVEAYVDVVAKLRVQDDQAKVTLRGRQSYQVKLKENERKRLHEMLDVLEFNQVVILVKSVHRLTALTQTLVENNFPPISIHREMTQEERLSSGFQQFKDLNKKVLAATNLFGKTADTDRVNVVISHDSNEEPETFLTRVAPFASKSFAVGFMSEQVDPPTLHQTEIRQRHISSSPSPKKVAPDTTLTPEGATVLSPQGRHQLRNRLAKGPIKFEGNPDTQITRTFEFHLLVLLMLNLSNLINSRLGTFFEKHYFTRSIISHVLHIILAPPVTYQRVSKEFDLQPQMQTTERLPPRVCLRFLAHKGVVTFVIVFLGLLHLIGLSFFFTIFVGSLAATACILAKATISWVLEKLQGI